MSHLTSRFAGVTSLAMVAFSLSACMQPMVTRSVTTQQTTTAVPVLSPPVVTVQPSSTVVTTQTKEMDTQPMAARSGMRKGDTVIGRDADVTQETTTTYAPVPAPVTTTRSVTTTHTTGIP